eukprot:gnl/TRDRNA2_/TRDRNA2_175434_c2_seq2.p1 gnl/TRDRNA2_/TRDRNA2_175434_c2~~gnl/TRDRNA2_/TRDRNA2_175434_c2_seq2.p1  ORF type:complete len:423 (+),score=37.84 gnl/TRDRNA2_/TRDRNA2_175434_c2_seq2:156-1271(+)
MLAALGNGSYSDVIGRRPLIRIFGTLTVLPLVALTFHITAGLTLWVYLLLVPVVFAFDVNGVFLALMSDLIPDPKERAGAFGMFIAVLMLIWGITMPFAFMLPRQYTLTVSVVAAALKLVYLFCVFPETATRTSIADEGSAVGRQGICSTISFAFHVLTRHSFIFRMALVLTISGLASSGYAIIMQPFMIGYLGFSRMQLLSILSVAGTSMILTFLFLLGPLVARVGDVRVLQISLFAAAVFPAICARCSELWQMLVLVGLLAGPLALIIPVVSAIKSNLVSADEQGLVQGAIASIGKATATFGFLFFGWLFRCVTENGKMKSQSAILLPFLFVSGINAAALILAGTLATVPPPPPDSAGTGTEVELSAMS